MLSIVIPAYNEELLIKKSTQVIKKLLADENIDNEIIFIDDGSKDNTWSCIEETARHASGIKGVRFSRNFGKEAAIIAGLSASAGDCCVVMDCDLQHPPEKIIDMYRLWQEKKYDIVEGKKLSRGDESVIHKFSAKIFYSLISAATGLDMSNASDFKLLDRRVVDILINMKERNAFFRALSSWVGFNTISIYFDVQERSAGSSKWSSWGLVKYAFRNISSFSAVPMQIVTLCGFITLFLTFFWSSFEIIRKITHTSAEGFPTVIILQLFSSSIIMVSLGIIGYYISQIYDEIKERPRYIISQIRD